MCCCIKKLDGATWSNTVNPMKAGTQHIQE